MIVNYQLTINKELIDHSG